MGSDGPATLAEQMERVLAAALGRPGRRIVFRRAMV